MLEHFYTDVYAGKGWPMVLHALPNSVRSPVLKRLLGRVAKELPPAKVTSYTWFGLDYNRRLLAMKRQEEASKNFIWAGKEFCKRIVSEDGIKADGVYGFNGASLELFRLAKSRGMVTVLDQTSATYDFERSVTELEYQTFCGWEIQPAQDVYAEKMLDRQKAEWALADLIICGSQFVKDALIASGGPGERAVVVPYGVDKSFPVLQRPARSGPLRVLTVGGVRLQKGSQYVVEAAKRLKDKAVFRMVGEIHLNNQVIMDASKFVQFCGVVPRSEILQHYEWADVFLFPSICEGSAGVTYEALSTGLPVICTPNAGSVVRDQEDGFIVPIRNVEEIVEKIEIFSSNRKLLASMSMAAAARRQYISTEAYGARLINALSTLV
jgi:glycosyltransferase involved in cell wall biosynthesis